MKAKPGQRVRAEMVPDYELSKFQDDLREAIEIAEGLLSQLVELEMRASVVKERLGMPAAPLSLRDNAEFFE